MLKKGKISSKGHLHPFFFFENERKFSKKNLVRFFDVLYLKQFSLSPKVFSQNDLFLKYFVIFHFFDQLFILIAKIFQIKRLKLVCLELYIFLSWGMYQCDHEDGNGQYEVNFEYDECLNTADKHMFFKFMAKEVAKQHGRIATFMPKPFADITGKKFFSAS